MQYRDLSGQKFGKLTAIKRCEKPKHSKSKNRGSWWEFKCDCGNSIVLYYPDVVREDRKGKPSRKHCGCLTKYYWNSKNYKGFGELAQSHWSHIIYAANSRNIEFNITIEYAWNLFLQQDRKCFYSGDTLMLTPRNKEGKRTASLDRLDSSKGYIVDNVVWCRKDINIMKMKMSHEKFIETCRQITEYQTYVKNLNGTLELKG
jgi:hypothetical protein